MKKDNLITMASISSNAMLSTPEMVLKDALDSIGKTGSFKEGKQLLILALDRGEKGDDYNISFIQAGMNMSECIALCDISKTLFLTEMNYIPGSYNE